MKLGELIEYNKRNIFFKNEGGRLVPDFFSFFKKAKYEVEASCLHLSFNIFR